MTECVTPSLSPASPPAATTPPIEDAVILARGLGTRMRAAAVADGVQLSAEQAAMAAKGVKAMIGVGERPFLDHVMSAAADAGLRRFVLVIGPEHDEIRRYYSELGMTRVSVDFAVQQEPLGTGNALDAAREATGGRPFVMLNSDNFYPTGTIAELGHVPGCGVAGFSPDTLVAGGIPDAKVRAFALIEHASGRMVDIVEKPDEQTYARLRPTALVNMNCYAFTREIFDFTGRLTPSARGEYELTDAVRAAVRAGVPFSVVPASAGVLDMSSRADITAVEAALAGHEVVL